jgi:imidazole glycerol-phosphate synthase subunit HisH
MGWNDFERVGGKIMEGLRNEENVYFVHSYFAELGENTTAICNYIQPFSAVLEKDNFYATQFHPEKSSGIGERILTNFLKL